MIYIILDTNQIWNKERASIDKIFSDNLSDVKKFLKDNKKTRSVHLCITEMILEERLQHKKVSARESVSKINEKLKYLKPLGYKEKPVSLKKDQDLTLDRIAKKSVAEYSLDVIKTPKIDIKDIITRAVEKIKPFDVKDAIIFYSIVEHAKKKRNAKYIFVSKNTSHFPDELKEEFYRLTKKELYIVDDIESLKSLLDELLTLRRKLKILHEEIKEGIKKRTGTMTSQLNMNIRKKDNSLSTPFGIQHTSQWFETGVLSVGSTDKEVLGYDFMDISIDNISELGEEMFEVRGYLAAKIIYNESEGTILGWSTENRKEKIVGFYLVYNKKTGNISKLVFEKS